MRSSLVLLLLAAGCGSQTADPAPSASAAEATSSLPTVAAPSASTVDATPTPSGSIEVPTRGDPGSACPTDMRLVAGEYCTAPEQFCLAWNEVTVGAKVERNQCKLYREPSRCLTSKRTPMRFCMDRYEWPNKKGAIPRNLTSWQEAKDTCEGIGKRLCTDVEFTFACEGEAMRPHVHGFARDGTKCSYDRAYRQRTFNFAKHDACLADAPCKAALDAIDQRLPAGSMPECVSEDGIYDLNGNVNEWVQLPNKGFSHRAGLKGGWWGPVRDRCRPITTFHGESDFGYEVGFRCCKDAL
jgi:sulfatase modifying factor 1